MCARELHLPDNWRELVEDGLVRLVQWPVSKASLVDLVFFVRNHVSHALKNFYRRTALQVSLQQELGWAGSTPTRAFAEIGVMRRVCTLMNLRAAVSTMTGHCTVQLCVLLSAFKMLALQACCLRSD